MPSEPGRIRRDIVLYAVSCQECPVLLYPDMTFRIDIFTGDIPVCAVAPEIRAVVQKHRIAHDLTVLLPVHFHQSGHVGGYEADQ